MIRCCFAGHTIPSIFSRHFLIHSFLIFPLCWTLSSCTGAVSKYERDVARLEGELTTLRSFQADQTTQVSSLGEQVRELNGRLDELEHQQRAQLGTGLRDVQRDLDRLTARVPPPPIVPNDELSSDESLVSKIPPPAGDRFAFALQKLRLGEFSEALPALRESAELVYGTEELSAPAQFWTGIALEGLTDNRTALETYHKLIEMFPKHPRSRLALLRQASLLIRMGDGGTAKIILQKLITDHPGTTEAARAKERLKDV